MLKLIRMELKKAVCSKYFLMGVSLLSLFAFLSAWFMVENWGNYNPDTVQGYRYYADGKYIMNPDIALFSFYKAWVGADVLSLAGMMFFYIFPVAAALPYGWTFCREYKSGYLKNIASRVGKKKYLAAKTIAVFTSGALVVLIPLLINILLVSAYLPCIDPYVVDSAYVYTNYGFLWADILFDNPPLYVALFVMLDTLYGGIFALLSFAVSFYIKNIFAAIFFPFLSTLVLSYLNQNIWINLRGRIRRSISPIEFLPALQGGNTVWWIVLIVTAVFMLFIFCTIVLKGCRDEIF